MFETYNILCFFFLPVISPEDCSGLQQIPLCETHSVVKAEVFVLYYIQKDIYTLLTFDSLQLSATKNLLNIRDLSVYKTRNMLYIIPYTLVCIICNVCNNNKYKNLNIIIIDLHGQALNRIIQFSNTSICLLS